MKRIEDTQAAEVVPDFSNRECGISQWRRVRTTTPELMMSRHKKFDTVEDYQLFCDLILPAPYHVYFSAAVYASPSEPDMQKKREGWLGTNLVFDVDDDHIRFVTLSEFDKPGIRSAMDFIGLDPNIPWEIDWAAASGILRLPGLHAVALWIALDELLGMTRVRILDSGRRGYHVWCLDDLPWGYKVMRLDKEQRTEVVHLLAGVEKDVKGFGKREKLRIREGGQGIQFDYQVTIDPVRLMRLPGSRHGKTNKIASWITINELRSKLRRDIQALIEDPLKA